MTALDLVARLTAALDETEARARAVVDENWREDVAESGNWNEYDEGVREHILAHDPERELRMIAAHRKILNLHRSWDDAYPDLANPDYPERGCIGCGFDGQEERITENVDRCPIVLALAEAYGIEA